MVWWLDDLVLQDAYHRLRASALGKFLDPVWSCMGLHTPAEFNKRHIPPASAASRPRLGDGLQLHCAPTTGISRPRRAPASWRTAAAASWYPDVRVRPVRFRLLRLRWVLAFEADTLDRLEGVMHASATPRRATCARTPVLHPGPRYRIRPRI